MQRTGTHGGFVLVELLVVALIVGTLAAAQINTFANQKPEERANLQCCITQMRALNAAVETYQADHHQVASLDQAVRQDVIQRGYLTQWPVCPSLAREAAIRGRTPADYVRAGSGEISCPAHGTVNASHPYVPPAEPPVPPGPIKATAALLLGLLGSLILGGAFLSLVRGPAAGQVLAVRTHVDPMEEFLRSVARPAPAAARPGRRIPSVLESTATTALVRTEIFYVAGGHCPICATALDGNDVRCAECGTPHHRECFDWNGQCGLYGCGCQRLDARSARAGVRGTDASPSRALAAA